MVPNFFLTMKVKTFSSRFNYAKVMAALVRNLTIPLMDIRMRINFYYEDLRTYLRNEKICYRSIAIKESIYHKRNNDRRLLEA